MSVTTLRRLSLLLQRQLGARLLNTIHRLPILLCGFVLLFSCAAQESPAQTKQYTDNKADQSLKSDLHIDPSTLGMSLEVPLAAPPGRAGTNLPIALRYSSKVWRISYSMSWNSQVSTQTWTRPQFSENSVAGWTSSLEPPRVEYTGEHQLFDEQGYALSDDPDNMPVNSYYIKRINVHMPDGSSHELRHDDTPQSSGGQYDFTGDFYAVDGSRLRFNADSGVLYMPDGGQYQFGALQTLTKYRNRMVEGRWAISYKDRNGNAINFNGAGGASDTLARNYGTLLPDDPAVGDQSYTVQGVGGPVTYTLRWSHLSQAFSDPNSQASYTSNSYCSTPYVYQARSPYLFTTDAAMHVCADTDIFDPVVLSDIILPNNQVYHFRYNPFGEIDKVTLPTGGYERYRYDYVTPLSFMDGPYSEANRGVVERWVSAKGDGSDEAHWQYSSTGTQVTTTAPDGTRAERLQYTEDTSGAGTFGCGDPRVGMAYEERAFSSTGQMLRRRLMQYDVSGATPGGAGAAQRNARITKEVSLLLDTGGSALASTTTYGYDTTYQFDVGVDQNWVREYDYAAVAQSTAQTGTIASMPLGSLLRQTQTVYKTSDINYRSRNLLNLPSTVTIYDAYGSLAATTDYGYDEAGYLLSDYANVLNWVDPQTSIRGNVTSVSRWLNTTNTRLVTRTQYDQCGNVRSAWDALNRQSQIGYASPYNDYAYPTSTTSAVPDSTGVHASQTALTTSSTYDYYTGLVLTSTDANNKTTTYHYTDPQTGLTDSINRLRWIERPSTGCGTNGTQSCGTTVYKYGDTVGNLFIETLSSMDSSHNVDSYQYMDGMGRTSRTLLNESGSWLITDTQYDAMGRVWRVSNPYRSTQGNSSPVNPSGNWTTNVYDDLGRVKTATTADTAAVTTSYSGNTVTVTDQHDSNYAGNSRKSTTDALGRLTQVIEDPSGVAYQTNYAYDPLGNLRLVIQGSQSRFFMYDSLSRLIRVKNPEQSVNTNLAPLPDDPISGNSAWAISYDYDAAGNLQTRIDARGVRTDYTYDGLNRNLTVRYSNDPASTPGVDRYYDGATLGKGRLWQTITSGAANSYTTTGSYDAMGRALEQRQQFYYNNAWSQNYTVQRSYDQAGHILSQTYPSGRVVSYGYDAAGRMQSFTGNLGDGVQRSYSTGISYNEWGMQQEQFGTQTPVYNKRFYNVRGQLSEIRESTTPNDTSWNRGAIINHYSSHCWGMCSVDPTSATDDNGNLTKQDYYIPRDEAVSGYDVYTDFYQYDSLNRVQSARESLNGGAINWQQAYTYDQWGNRIIDQNNTYGTGIPRPQFNVNTATNQLTVPAGQSGALQYDAAGNLYNDTYTGYGLRTFDAENRMLTARDTFGGTSSYVYDGDGKRVRRVSNAEVWQVYGMDGELLSEYAANAAPAMPQKEYGYRSGELLINASNVTTVNTSLSVSNSGFEAPVLSPSGYQYNAAGGSWTFAGGTGVAANNSAFTYGNPNASEGNQVAFIQGGSTAVISQSVSGFVAGTSYRVSFMAAQRGNCCGAGGQDVQVYLDNTLLGTFNPQGTNYSRLETNDFTTSAGTHTLKFVGLNSAGGDNTAFIDDVKVNGSAQGTGGASINWLVTDQLGTPRMVLDQSGSLSAMKRHDYFPFGEELFAGIGGRTTGQGYSGNDSNSFKYAKLQRDDETGLDYAQARYYASTQGRFTSPDPFMGSGKTVSPQSWNRYTYCINNPLLLTDPTGLEWGYYDYTQKGEHLRKFAWFDGKVHGKGWHTYRGSSDVTLVDGRTVRLGRGTYQVIGAPPPRMTITGQERLNAAAGAVDGLPGGRYLREGVLGGSGGVDTDSPEYQNASTISNGTLQGALLFTGGGEAKAAEAAEEEVVTLFHGSTTNASQILESGLDVTRQGATYVSTDIAAAQDAIAARAAMGGATDAGIITSKVPRGDFQSLIESGAIKSRPYNGFYPYRLNTVEHLLISPEAKALFNRGIVR